MIFHKHKNHIFKVELSAKEQKALEDEINLQLIEKHKEFTDNVDYMIMNILHSHFGWGLTRLRRFYDVFCEENNNLIKHYEASDAAAYIARREMNKIGCNIEEWNSERGG